ncbi:MAG: NADH-quinone oxidoreductase subunit 5 family protein [Candidatus Kariarchaeaceae archaeon]|jgi:NADH-quinone oxidoreductase subunit L
MDHNLLIYLILLPPFTGAMLAWIGDKLWSKFSRTTGLLSIGISGISALISFVLVAIGDWDASGWNSSKWFGETYNITLVINPDALAIFMATVAAFLGFLIAIFSLEYMSGDENLTRYWFFIQLFIGGMVLLVLAGDLVLMYAGWEIVGLCSFGLIAHWYTKPGEDGEKCAKSGIKAFVFTRIGDIGFLVAIVLIYYEFGTIRFDEISAATGILESRMLTIIGLLFLMAAFGKSAQIPFIPWLSSPEDVDIDAMQGPTTVSALIHAATMVKAGVYLVSRLYLLLPLADSEIFVWTLVSAAGITALIAALSALVSFDLKRILAYSTVSQLAYMFLGVGMAFVALRGGDEHLSETSFLAAQFHLISHALFKSLLFLSAGYLIHKMGTRDIREMRGSASRTADKIAFSGFIVGGLSLAGLPPFNGFWSKEAIIGAGFVGFDEGEVNENLSLMVYFFGAITALVTAMYVIRLFYYIFTGESKAEGHHGSSKLMQLVITVISILALLGGLLQLVLEDFFETIPVLGTGYKPEFHSITDDTTMINTFGISVGILVILVIGWRLQISNPKIGRSFEKIFFIGWIAKAAREGFYLEKLWMSLWYLLKSICYEFRKTHTGDLNYAMFAATAVSVGIVFFIVGG